MRNSKWNNTFEESFLHASEGLDDALHHEDNLKVEIIIAIITLLLSLLFKVTKGELIIIIFSMALVMVTELINTSIEAAVDTSTNHYDKNAKYAKDLAAGSVIFATSFAGICGYLIFADKIYAVIKNLIESNNTNILIGGVLVLLVPILTAFAMLIRKKNGISIMSTLITIALFVSTAVSNMKIFLVSLILLLITILLHRKSPKKDTINYVIRMYTGVAFAIVLLCFYLIYFCILH